MSNKIIVFIVLIFLLSVNSASAQFQTERTPQQQSLDAVNKQIDELRSQQVPSPLYGSNNLPTEDNTNNSKMLGYILAGILIFILVGSGLYNYAQPQNIEERKRRRERERTIRVENIKLAKEEQELKQQEKLEEKQRIKQVEFQRNSNFMDRIRQTPRYQRWKEEVKEKCGNICQIDKSHADRYAEVHHLISLYKILKQNNIISIEGALGCRQLWDIDNGIVLCKECHDEMESSQNRQNLIKNIK